MAEIRIEGMDAQDIVYCCESVSALIEDMLCDRHELELGRMGMFGLFLLVGAQRSALDRARAELSRQGVEEARAKGD